MQEPQEQPIHWDSYRRPWNLTLIFSLIIAFIGLIMRLQGGDWLLFVVGVVFAVFSWFTTPKQFMIYPNSLLIAYGRPRVKVIPFSQISHPEMLNLPIGVRLRLRMVNGRRMVLEVRDPETFLNRLDEALDRFRGSQMEGQPPGETSERQNPP